MRGAARRVLQEYGLVLVLVVLIAVVAIREPSFVEGQSLLNLLEQWAPVGIMAVAGTFVIISGGFDFSVGGIFALATVCFAGFAGHVPVGVAFIAALGVGLFLGVTNGLVITKLRVNPFIATLAMGQIAHGIGLVYTDGTPFIVEGDSFAALGLNQIGPFVIPSVVMILAFLVGGFVLSRTTYGRSMYALGGNRDAARLSGIKVDRRLITAYAVSGVSAALAGAFMASRLGTGQADASAGIEFDVVIAIVLGGTAISGGFGAMWRTAVGLGLLAVMQNGFDSLQINPFYQVVIKGVVLIIAVAWDEYVRRRKENPAISEPIAPPPRAGRPGESAVAPSEAPT
ncbi:Ribose import permease protein RbsC [Capillimicrobium parvum]|uniref:Ribose import permease protein RbsC n=1 Tax=Capillimicrobium parvum TaxID=2884022 RepID=A0A9E6Y2K0_9ACTN|nr:Ribose import permease protein RbsC [Capillimicrobium parvum]